MRIAALLMEYLDIPLPWHADQPYLAEWQAFSAREILFHLDQTVDARNMAQAQAKKHDSHLVQDDAEDDGPAPDTRRFVIEDIGGAPADLGDEEPPDDLGCEKHELRLPPNTIALVLSRAAERAEKNRPGRPRDARKVRCRHLQRCPRQYTAAISNAIWPGRRRHRRGHR